MTSKSGQEKPQLGFIGLGHMGRSMVERFMNAGYHLNDLGLALMYKDFGLILEQAAQLPVPMPATAAEQQTYTAAMVAEQVQEVDYSVMLRFMEQLAEAPAKH